MSGTTETDPLEEGLSGVLFTPVQQRVLGLLFAQPDRRFQSAEIIRRAASGTGAVHRQLQRLAGVGLVVVSREGNQKYYQANRQSPIFGELHGLIVKTVGLVGPLQAALEPLAERLRAAFVYGSIARGTATAKSDVDLLVVAEGLDYADLLAALHPVEATLGRPINPTLLSPAEWRDKLAVEHSFVARIAAQPRVFVIGSDDALH